MSVRMLTRGRGMALLVVAPLLLLGAVAVAGSAADPGPGTCNRNYAEASSVEFQVGDAEQLHSLIPMLGLTPELDSAGPLTVVIFDGLHQAIPLYPPLAPSGEPLPTPNLNDVLCVVDSGGIENFYADVDFAGVDLHGVEVDRSSD